MAGPADTFVSIDNFAYVGHRATGTASDRGDQLVGSATYTLTLNPTPPIGEFRPLLRMYEPDPAILNRDYEVPAIVRMN